MPRRAKSGGGGAPESAIGSPAVYGGSAIVMTGGDGSPGNPFRGYVVKSATITGLSNYDLLFGLPATTNMALRIKNIEILVDGSPNVTVLPTIALSLSGSATAFGLGEKKMTQWAKDTLVWLDLDAEFALTTQQFEGVATLTSGTGHINFVFENTVPTTNIYIYVMMEWYT